MALNPDQHRLSEAEHQAIFERNIKPVIFSDVKPSSQPVAVIFGGQPGAGKSATVENAMNERMARCGLSTAQLIAIGIGVPGPVDFASGQLVNPPLMPDWDGFSIRDYLREAFAVPVFVDNGQSVYHRSLALSTRHLEIQSAPLADDAGLVGAGVLAMQESMARPENMARPRSAQ